MINRKTAAPRRQRRPFPYVVPRQDPEDQALRDLIPSYEKARDAVAAAKTLDEVRSIPKQFDQLRAAGRITANFDFELMLAEIKLSAFRRIGEISFGLEKSKGGRGKKTVSDDENSFKLATLAKAGIAKSTAYRAERVAKIEQRHFDQYLKECRQQRKPITVNDLLETVLTRLQVADLDDRDQDARTKQMRARHQAYQRERQVLRARKTLERMLRLERKLTLDDQRLELALVVASGLSFSHDREILKRLLSEDTVAQRIKQLKGDERSLFICRLRDNSLSQIGDEERADRGFMPPHRESVQRRMVRLKREARAAATSPPKGKPRRIRNGGASSDGQGKDTYHEHLNQPPS